MHMMELKLVLFKTFVPQHPSCCVFIFHFISFFFAHCFLTSFVFLFVLPLFLFCFYFILFFENPPHFTSLWGCLLFISPFFRIITFILFFLVLSLHVLYTLFVVGVCWTMSLPYCCLPDHAVSHAFYLLIWLILIMYIYSNPSL